MPASSFLSRATRLARLACLACIALTVATVPSCRSLEIWGHSQEEMRSRLASGDHSFLRDIDFGRHAPEDALQLGEGAPYLLGLAFQSQGLQAQAQQLLRLQVMQGEPPWDALALPPLLESLNQAGDYDTAQRLARRHLADSAETLEQDRVAKGLVEALYWAGDDGATLAELAARFPSGRSTSQPELDAELALFKAVASSRLGAGGWQELYLRLCLDHPASAVHTRLSLFVSREEGIRAGLPPAARALLEAKAAMAAGRPAQALDPIEAAIGDLGPRPTELLLRESAAAYLAAGEAVRGARLIAGVARTLDGSARLAAEESAGRLYRAAGAGSEAAALLSSVAAATADSAQRDRVLWVLADMAARGSARAGIAALERTIGAWTDPEYFDDLVDGLATRLLADNDRNGMRRLFDAIGGLAIPSRIRLYYILSRLGDRRLPEPEPLLRSSRTTVSQDYYRLMLNLHGPREAKAAAGAEAAVGEMDFLMARLVDFGLYDRAMALARTSPARVSRAARLRASRQLAERRRYRDAISLLGNGLPWDPGRSEASLLAYPRAFEREIAALAAGEELPEHLLFAVVREESAFDPRIVSSAGAVGLTQLLPSTASDEARRLRMSAYDLRQPLDNLAIGFHYLGRLVRLQRSVPFGLAAYNAGLTRLRQWKQQFAHLPPDLLLEAIPFEETRHYVRKVLVSAAIYGELYQQIPAARTAEAFFKPLE